MIRDPKMRALRKVKAPSGQVMSLSASVASGLVGGSEKWEYVDGGPVQSPEGKKPKGDSMTGGSKGKKQEPSGMVGTSDKSVVEQSEPAEDPKQDPEADQGESVEKPAGNSSQEDWVEYAVARGMDRDELARYSRNEIRELFADDKE